MPELPEVEMVVRGLREDVLGRSVGRVTVHWPRSLETIAPADFAARLEGQRINTLDRRGKYILFGLTHDVMLVHLRMTGRLYVSPPRAFHDADRWLRVVFDLDDGQELRFSDLRKLGRVYLAADPDEVLGNLGPEPLSDAFTSEVFAGRMAGRSGLLKPLLLNQSLIAGVGNIYADEALWRAGIAPQRKADTLKPEEVNRLYRAIREVLQDGIAHEGASVNWYRKPDGTAGEQQHYFNVYGCTDKPCPRCGTLIRKIRLGQRGTHFCPACQK